MTTSQLLMLIAHLDRMNAALDVALADLLAVEVTCKQSMQRNQDRSADRSGGNQAARINA